MLAELRDRFGLIHYDPADTGPLPLAVFRYPVEALPHVDGISGVVLVSPTVLECGQSAAFCPCPQGTQFGTAVPLQPGPPSPGGPTRGSSHGYAGSLASTTPPSPAASWRRRLCEGNRRRHLGRNVGEP
jgi:hypothetical protein